VPPGVGVGNDVKSDGSVSGLTGMTENSSGPLPVLYSCFKPLLEHPPTTTINPKMMAPSGIRMATLLPVSCAFSAFLC